MATKEVLAIVLIAFGGLVVAFAVVVEPSGELHGSVLAFWGETLGTALLLVGVKQTKHQRRKTMKESKFTHEEGMTFLSALVALIYKFVKSIKKKD